MDLGLEDATVVVTGGTNGMGRAAAECFAREGARVAVIGRNRDRLGETVDTLHALGSPDAVPLSCDLFVTEEVDSAFDDIGQRWGHLNALVNIAGPNLGYVSAFEELADDDWQHAFDQLVLGFVRATRAALPLLRAAEWARVVNLSAHSTQRQSPRIVHYTAGKAAVTSISKNLARSLGRDGILVNTVSPGTFMSQQLRDLYEDEMRERGLDFDDPADVMQMIVERHGQPSDLGRAGRPAEMGPVVTFLASRANTYMTGANVNVDGGSDFV